MAKIKVKFYKNNNSKSKNYGKFFGRIDRANHQLVEVNAAQETGGDGTGGDGTGGDGDTGSGSEGGADVRP